MTTSAWVAMSDVHEALAHPPYFVAPSQAAAVAAALRQADFKVFDADVDACTDERDLLTVLGDTLAFPDYYDPNWDAFYDCVGDLRRQNAGRIAVMLVGADALLAQNAHAFVRSVHLLLEAVSEIEQSATSFQLEFIFVGTFDAHTAEST